MKWEHYDKRELTVLDPAWQYEQGVHHKPRGLWLSDADQPEDDWPSWCKAEDFHLDEITHRHEVVLAEGWDILHIGTIQQLRDFHAEYSVPIAPGMPIDYIDWRRVADDYDGIIITPYQWTVRLDLDLHWYYTWDVASACIWNVEAIESIRYVP